MLLLYDQQGYWQIALDALDVGSKQIVADIQAIIDSGTTLIAGDPQTVAAFYAAIPGSADASESLGEGLYTCKGFDLEIFW